MLCNFRLLTIATVVLSGCTSEVEKKSPPYVEPDAAAIDGASRVTAQRDASDVSLSTGVCELPNATLVVSTHDGRATIKTVKVEGCDVYFGALPTCAAPLASLQIYSHKVSLETCAITVTSTTGAAWRTTANISWVTVTPYECTAGQRRVVQVSRGIQFFPSFVVANFESVDTVTSDALEIPARDAGTSDVACGI